MSSASSAPGILFGVREILSEVQLKIDDKLPECAAQLKEADELLEQAIKYISPQLAINEESVVALN